MGYESRLYIVEKSDYYSKVDVGFKKVKKMCFGEVVAMIDLCKVPDIPAAIKSYPDTDTYIYEGEERIIDDKYGEPLKEIPIKNMIEIVKKAAENDDSKYRRWKPCLALLKGFSGKQWQGLVVLHYGH